MQEIGCYLHSKAINSNLMTFNNTALPCYPTAMSCCAVCTNQSPLIKSCGGVLADLDQLGSLELISFLYVLLTTNSFILKRQTHIVNLSYKL